jgi:glycosyltransferase involved in cell wall biosynthesis
MNDYEFLCASFIRKNAPNEFLRKAAQANLATVELNDSFAGDFRVIRQIKNMTDRFKPDIMICHDYKANFFGWMAIRNSAIRMIAHFRGYTREDMKVRFYNSINAWLLRRMSKVLAVSEKSGSILQSMGVPEDVIKIVPNAIEDKKLISFNFIRQIPEGKKLIGVCAGRLSHEKGHDILLKAISLVKDKTPQFRIDIYGDGPEEKNLKSMTQKLGIGDYVKFCGFTDNILPVLKESDFMILPSRSEGMPNILLEAWSQKLAVIATTVGGVPEMIKPGRSGLLSPPDNPEALADKLLYGLNNPIKLIEYGQEGYNEVKRKYSYERQGEILRRIYSGETEGK